MRNPGRQRGPGERRWQS